MYDARMTKAFEDNKKKFEKQTVKIVEQVRGQCSQKLADQVESYREQIKTCNKGYDSTDEKLQAEIEQKLKCEKKLIE